MKKTLIILSTIIALMGTIATLAFIVSGDIDSKIEL